MRGSTDVFGEVYEGIAGRLPAPDDVRFEHADVSLPGPFLVGPAATACVATATLCAADLVRARGTEPGPVTVDGRGAALAFG